MDKKDFKFKFKFNSAFEVKKGPEFGKFLSTANLSKLKPLMPAGIDLDNNPDITGIVLNAANGNFCNKNGDSIDNVTLVKIAKNFLFKRVDIEHLTNENIGVIVNYGFSSFGSNDLLTEEEVINSKLPVNLSLALILWDSSISDELYNLIINSANPNSPEYGAISASWELYYNDYDICLGHSKIVSECKIFSGEEKEKYEDFLPKHGGLGKIDNNYLFRLIKCDDYNLLLPVGIGLVENPAAEVKGLEIIKRNMKTQANIEIEIENEDPENEKEDMKCESCGEKMSKNDQGEMVCAKCKSKSDQSMANTDTKSVIDNKENKNKEKLILISKDMTIKSFKELTDESLKIVTAADIVKVHEQLVSESIREANEKYSAKLAENEVLASKQKETEEKLNESLLKVEEISAKLKELEAKEANRIAEGNFNARMEKLDKEFEISDEARTILAKEVKVINSSEDFDSYFSKMALFLKKKEITASKKVETPVETLVNEAVASANTKIEIPNAGNYEQTYKDLVEKAFAAKNITIKI